MNLAKPLPPRWPVSNILIGISSHIRLHLYRYCASVRGEEKLVRYMRDHAASALRWYHAQKDA